MSVFDVEVSFFDSVTSKEPRQAILRDLLFSGKYMEEVFATRMIRANEGEAAYKAAKMRLPLFTPSGLFSGSTADSLIRHSGFICVDVDGKDNPELDDFDEIKDLISQVDCVSYCGRSVSAQGYFMLIKIAHPNEHKRHFEALRKDFARCGLTIDKACKDIGRKRFVSYDSRPYVNDNAKIYERLGGQRTERTHHRDNRISGDDSNDVDKLVDAICAKGVDITGGYDQWFRIGCAIASEYGERGRSLFHRISEQGPSYDHRKCDAKYTDCLRTEGNIGIGTLFYYAKQYGL